jgi:hypothetical protein
MRRRPTLIVVSATAVAAAVVSTALAAPLGPTVTGSDGNTQAIGVKMSPSKLSKTTPTPAKLNVTTKTTSVSAANGIPSPAVRAVVDFDKNTKLFTKGLPTCNPSKIQSTSTEIAERECRPAKIGTGRATALIPVGTQVFTQNQTVTAFNAPPKGGKPVVLLHAYGTSPVQVTLVLEGTVSGFDKQGYGPRLDISIPLIAGGTGALTEFEATISKSWSYKGKKRSFVTSECQKSPLKARGAFTFKDGSTLTAFSTQKCTPKK